jgi:hypothetical protein
LRNSGRPSTPGFITRRVAAFGQDFNSLYDSVWPGLAVGLLGQVGQRNERLAAGHESAETGRNGMVIRRGHAVAVREVVGRKINGSVP